MTLYHKDQAMDEPTARTYSTTSFYRWTAACIFAAAFLLLFVFNRLRDDPAWWIGANFLLCAGLAAYVSARKIIVSPAGIEERVFWRRRRIAWDQVERFVFDRVWVKLILRRTAANTGDLTFHLTPYLQDLAAGPLLADSELLAAGPLLAAVHRYAPHLDIPAVIRQYPTPRKAYQYQGGLAAYHMLALAGMVLLYFMLWESVLSLPNQAFHFLGIIAASVCFNTIACLALNLFRLGRYNREIADQTDSEAERTARRYYLAPLVALAGGLLLGLLMWGGVMALRIPVSGSYNLFGIPGIFLSFGYVMLSDWLERRLFPEKRDRDAQPRPR